MMEIARLHLFDSSMWLKSSTKVDDKLHEIFNIRTPMIAVNVKRSLSFDGSHCCVRPPSSLGPRRIRTQNIDRFNVKMQIKAEVVKKKMVRSKDWCALALWLPT